MTEQKNKNEQKTDRPHLADDTSGLFYENEVHADLLVARSLVVRQDAVAKANARVETELETAARIQLQALPSIGALPKNEYYDLDIAARMTPAKEVGGDFYDCFYLDSTHLALMIADVADKGIAAALYMMMSKSLLDDHLTASRSPGRILEDVNRRLYKKSIGGMFVTVWLGILDLRTGEMVTANAGHEYPAICRVGGRFELFKDDHGFVLGGTKSMRYRETCLRFEPGDILFVYTDGVPEANDPGGTMLGEERMLELLDRAKDGSMEDLVDQVSHGIDSFSDGSPRFDDTTMLAVKFLSRTEPVGIAVSPRLEELTVLQDYVDSVVSEAAVPDLQAKKISISVDEIFSNIVKFSSATHVRLVCRSENGRIILTFTDDGIPFDPLAQQDPDLSPAGLRRKAGGLGIYITRQNMDELSYSRSEEKNILTLISVLHKGEEA